jgi:uncharacterized membrane protein
MKCVCIREYSDSVLKATVLRVYGFRFTSCGKWVIVFTPVLDVTKFAVLDTNRFEYFFKVIE